MLQILAKEAENKSKSPKPVVIPVEVENKFCSHIDPRTSTQIIQAHDLVKKVGGGSGNTNFKYWNDRQVKSKGEESFGSVPKRFYSNYKTNLVRDAHDLAKLVVSDSMQQHEPGCRSLKKSKRRS